MGLFLESNAHVKKLKANLMYISQSHKCVTKGKHIYRKTAAHAKSCPCLGDPSCFILVMFSSGTKTNAQAQKSLWKALTQKGILASRGYKSQIFQGWTASTMCTLSEQSYWSSVWSTVSDQLALWTTNLILWGHFKSGLWVQCAHCLSSLSNGICFSHMSQLDQLVVWTTT